jgi:hypothetical protein
MNEIRFVTIFAVSIAGWIVIMWLTLSALEAEQSAQRDHTTTPAPAAVEKQAEPDTGARSTPDGVVQVAHASPCVGFVACDGGCSAA